ncbi:MAG: 16S rRNA (cytidine(1402)-2'-O)-methyltransferase [Candidatus Cloacimonetes bacterium]|nr:16S rRNA (cytidine(1402)-2'-O)-methyltransferase [Candidatus Cloacimonadota bacterium]
MNKGTLYIIPTPIGNLGDITYRAVETLKNVALIGAEDTRHSALLLKYYQISTPTISYHKFNERSRIDKFLALLEEGKDVAIISDAGTPGISDPAAIVIKEAIINDFNVCTLPGATALLPALVSSGLNTERFLFCGFLPAKESEQKKLFEEIAPLTSTLIFYEAPHRITTFLKKLYDNLGDREVTIGRELTKKFETYYRNKLSYFIENNDVIKHKGEIVIICEGFPEEKEITDEEILNCINNLLENGETTSYAVNKVSKELKIPKNRVYALAHKKDENDK